jgi:hypothetical protein
MACIPSGIESGSTFVLTSAAHIAAPRNGGWVRWVDYRNNPMELRKKEYFLTDKGRALIHQFKRQLGK